MKNTLLAIAILLVGSFYAQDSTLTRLWDNGEKKIEGKYKNGGKEGEWNKWNKKGELTEKSIFQQGNLTTKTVNEYYTHTKNLLYEKKIFNSNAILIEKRLYSSQNNESYKIESYYNNGKIKSSGKILNGKKEGKWTAYNKDGNILVEQRLSSSQNKEPYKIINYYDNGNKKSSGKILNGKKEGKWTFYNENGDVLSNNKFKEGINVNNPNIQIIKIQEKEKKERIKAEKSIKKTYNNNNYSKGYYINKKGTKVDCYFKEGSLKSSKLIYKIDLNQKEKLLQLNDIIKFKFKEKTHTVIDVIKLKACNLIGRPIYENKITTDIIEGRINLYSTSVQCLIPMNDEGYSTKTTEIFIVKKGLYGEFQEMILKHNEFRELIKKLVKDDDKIVKEINFEEITYNDLPSIIKKYNSNKNNSNQNLSQPLVKQKSNKKEKQSCSCNIWLDKKTFGLHKVVTAKKECCLIISGLSKVNILKVYTFDPDKGGKELLSRESQGRKNIKMALSTLKSGTYFMSYKSRPDGWTILKIK